MSAISQKQAVVNAVAQVLGSAFVSGQTNVSQTLSADQKTQVRSLVASGISSGAVTYGKDRFDVKAVAKYTAGLVENHLRKAKELNGGTAYAPTKPRGPRGTKAVSEKDSQLVALITLQKEYTPGSDDFNALANAILKRRNELGQNDTNFAGANLTEELSSNEELNA